MSWEKVAEFGLKYGIAGVFALVLLWFVLTNVADAVKDHDAGTRALLRVICVSTTTTARRDVTECLR